MKMLNKLVLVLSSFFLFVSCNTSNQNNAEQIVSNNEIQKIDSSLQKVDSSLHKIDSTDLKYKNKPYLLAYDKALLLWQVPFTEKNVITKYGKAHVIICGPENGEPLVLLHGMNASSTMWYPNIKSFSEHYRVYAIDYFLEPGKSEFLGKSPDKKEIIDWYFEIFDQLQLEKFNLVGASRGGWLSVNIALRQASRIKKLVLLSPAQTFGIIKPGLDIFSNVNYSMNPKRKNLRDILETMSSNVDGISQIFINQYYLATKEAAIGKDVLEMQPFFGRELKSLKMPILVLIGDKDIINGEGNLNRAKRLCPYIQTGTITNAGHFLSIDQADSINKRILEFINSNSGNKK